ncbi:MFS transporter [Caminicella sporogenes]|uniref:MFS transporter n=1 Tax=Caminicella sporogenes TaxID=166485 RepID=UPI00254182EF|nr:MFS transporter [Caminicella sporogenes]WIF93939.1 MFS transporter [Caminicella sporogenes]
MDSKKLKKMIFVLGFMSFWANGDNYAVAPLLIDIAKDLNIEIGKAALSVTAYMLSFGFFTIMFGPLGDRFGKTKVINIAAFGTAIFSMLGALATSLPYLIIVRAINGAFGAGIFPVTMALVGETVEPSERQNTIGKVMGMMFLGGASATAIGGALAYFGSWRLVYFIYGLAELILAFAMLKVLEKSDGKIKKLNFTKVYKEALSNSELLRIVSIIFLMGFSIFGSFTYSGKYVQSVTGFNILIVGLILSLFGIGTVVGGRKTSIAKKILKDKFLLFAGVLGAISLLVLSYSKISWIIGISLFGFGLAFVFLQSTLVMKAQETLPKLRGTAMSLASFNMFVGGGVGTFINGKILNYMGINKIYLIASLVLLMVGIVANFVVSFEYREKKRKIQMN